MSRPGPPKYQLPRVGSKLKLPRWAAKKPIKTFKLEVLKEGKVFETLPLGSQTHWLMGRKIDICDVELAHPSLSREHAVIVHGKPLHQDPGVIDLFPTKHTESQLVGAVLIDLGAPNGTFLFKSEKEEKFERLKPMLNYLLHDGDCIRFGASTRSYIVRGMEEPDVGVLPKGVALQNALPTTTGVYGGFVKANLEEPDDDTQMAGMKRKKPKQHWETTSFGDDARKAKFLKLMGAEKQNEQQDTGYGRRKKARINLSGLVRIARAEEQEEEQ